MVYPRVAATPPKRRSPWLLAAALVVLAAAVIAAIVLLPQGGDSARPAPSLGNVVESATPTATPTSPTATPDVEDTSPVATATVTLPPGAVMCTSTVAVGPTHTSCAFALKVADEVDPSRGERYEVTAYSPVTHKSYTLTCTTGQYTMCTRDEIEVYVIR